MTHFDNYPPGAAHDSSAPYNEQEWPARDFPCKVTVELSKSMPIATDSYLIDNEDEGGIDAHTDNPDWDQDYHNDDRYVGIDGLLEQLSRYLRDELSKDITSRRRRYLNRLLDECSDWEVEEIYIDEQ